MAPLDNLPVGQIGLIQQLEDGRITQIGLTPSQSQMLQLLVASLCKERPLIRLPKSYDLVLASDAEELTELLNQANGTN